MTDYDAAYAFVGAALASAITAAGLSTVAYPDMAPDGTLPPYVVFGCATSIDTNTNGDVRVMAQFPFNVRAVLGGNVSTGPLGDAIEAALGRVRQVSQNGFLFNSKRVSSITPLTPITGRLYRYAGGRYLVTVRTTT